MSGHRHADYRQLVIDIPYASRHPDQDEKRSVGAAPSDSTDFRCSFLLQQFAVQFLRFR
jgi:hypothetical protein